MQQISIALTHINKSSLGSSVSFKPVEGKVISSSIVFSEKGTTKMVEQYHHVSNRACTQMKFFITVLRKGATDISGK
jgi:hypothetical protein